MSHNTDHSAHHTGRAASGGVGDTLRETAQSAADAVRQAADRAKRGASEAYESAQDWAEDQYDAYGRRTAYHYRTARSSTEQFVNENPVLIGVIGLAAGLLLGALLPRTRPEDRAFGHWADEVRDQGLRYARDVTQRGREYVEETLNEVARGVAEAGNRESQADQGGNSPAPASRQTPGQGAGREGPSGRFQNT